MAARHFVLTLTGAVQQLSTVLANTQVGGPDDVAARQIILQALPGNATAVAIGSATVSGATLSLTNCAVALDPTQATAQDRVSYGPFDAGAVKLSDFFALGANNEKLGITLIPF